MKDSKDYTKVIRCRMCRDNAREDRGLLNYRIKAKSIIEIKHLNYLVIACGCSEPVHKFCIFKKILCDQKSNCSNCGQKYLIEFITSDANFIKKIYYFDSIFTFLFSLMMFLICLAGILIAIFIKWGKIYYFWEILLIVIAGICLLISLSIIIRLILNVKEKKIVTNITFLSENKNSDIAHSSNDLSNFNKKNIVSFVHNIYKTVKDLDKKEMIENITYYLNQKFDLSTQEVIALKIDNSLNERVTKLKDFSILGNQATNNLGGTLSYKYNTETKLNLKNLILHTNPDKLEKHVEIKEFNQEKEKLTNDKLNKEIDKIMGKEIAKHSTDDHMNLVYKQTDIRDFKNKSTFVNPPTENKTTNMILNTNSHTDGITLLNQHQVTKDNTMLKNTKINSSVDLPFFESDHGSLLRENMHFDRELVLNISEDFEIKRNLEKDQNDSHFYLNSEEKFLD